MEMGWPPFVVSSYGPVPDLGRLEISLAPVNGGQAILEGACSRLGLVSGIVLLVNFPRQTRRAFRT